MSLAAVIITKNEEKNIRRCIESIMPICDEIIVVDSFSTDQTKEIVTSMAKTKFVERRFDDYIQQKNFANNLVSSAYILSLDADEYIDSTFVDFVLSRD